MKLISIFSVMGMICPLFADFIDLSSQLDRVDAIAMSSQGYIAAFDAKAYRLIVLKGNQEVADFSAEQIPLPGGKSYKEHSGPYIQGYIGSVNIDRTGVKADAEQLVWPWPKSRSSLPGRMMNGFISWTFRGPWYVQ